MLKNKFYNKYFVIGLILTLSLLWPLFVSPYFSHHDDVQTIRLFEMHQCFLDRQIPCRWVPDLGGGYGYPLFNYYGPLPYYVGEVFYLVTGSLIFSAKMMFIIPFLLGYVFMYLLGRKLWGELGGSLSGIFYSFAPYHAMDMYVRGAMGELWALMVFPAIGWSFLRTRDNPNLANSLLLGFFIGLLLLSHNLSTMIFIPFLLLAAGIIFLIKKSLNFLLFFALALLVSIILAAFYVLPMVFERDLIHIESTSGGYFSYTEHFKGLRRMILDTTWYYGQSVREVPGGERDTLSYQIGSAHLLTVILALISAYILWRKEKFLSATILFGTGGLLFAIFMIHPQSWFVWQLIGELKYLQFPWRFLLLATFFTSLIAGSLFAVKLPKKSLKPLWLGLVLAVVFINFSYFRPEKFLNVTDEQLLSGPKFDHYKMYAIFDYLPKSADAPPASSAPAPYEIITGDTTINDFAKGTDWMKFNAETRTHTILRLSQYYFPNWEITIDGKVADIDSKNQLGLMTLLLGEGSHKIEARLNNTPIRTIGNLVSGFGIVAFIILSLLSNKKSKDKLFYYFKAFNR